MVDKAKCINFVMNIRFMLQRYTYVVKTSTNDTKFYKHVRKRSNQTHNGARYVWRYSTIQCKYYMNVIIVVNITIYKRDIII